MQTESVLNQVYFRRGLISLFVLACLVGSFVRAQESTTSPQESSEIQEDIDEVSEDEAQAEKAKTAKREQAKKEQAKVETSNSKASDKVFIPTEEISEDKPVPFPVDI